MHACDLIADRALACMDLDFNLLYSCIPLLEMSDPGPSFREKCLLASRLVFQATDQYSAAVVFACAQLMSLGDMCCKQRLSRQPCMYDARS